MYVPFVFVTMTIHYPMILFFNFFYRYLSAKSNYFGVGGGVYDFIDFIKKEGLFYADICHEIQAGKL